MFRRLTATLLSRLDAWLLGTNVSVSTRGPFELHTTPRRTRVFRDGKFVTNTPDLATAQSLIDSYRKIGRI